MLEELLQYVRDEDRVCPVPERWNVLWEMLPGQGRVGPRGQPGLPLILSAWWHSSTSEKRRRVEEHIRWADEHGALAEVDGFLRGLQESDWHHLGD